MNAPGNTELLAAEWDQVAWGNYESNIEFLRRAGLTPATSRILEIGCGKGAILTHLQKAGHVVTGIDVDASALAYCLAPQADLPVSVASGASLPFASAAFDAVLSFDVFEHIRDSDRHLKEVRRVLRPGGTFRSSYCDSGRSFTPDRSRVTARSPRITAHCIATGR
jgi:SAM-dependent methyltransferase